jgi:pilus assembly protein Flp/PilA
LQTNISAFVNAGSALLTIVLYCSKLLEYGFRMRTLLSRFAGDRSGSTAIEYALMAALLAIAAMIGANAVGNGISGMYNNQANTVLKVIKQ